MVTLDATSSRSKARCTSDDQERMGPPRLDSCRIADPSGGVFGPRLRLQREPFGKRLNGYVQAARSVGARFRPAKPHSIGLVLRQGPKWNPHSEERARRCSGGRGPAPAGRRPNSLLRLPSAFGLLPCLRHRIAGLIRWARDLRCCSSGDKRQVAPSRLDNSRSASGSGLTRVIGGL